MSQTRMIHELFTWLRTQPFALDTRCDHVTENRQSLALYLGPRVPRIGRSLRIAEADILVCDTERNTVTLIIEVDPVNAPKKICGSVLPVLLADNYTPSGKGHNHAFKIRDTVVLYVTCVREKKGSQKRQQISALQKAIQDKLNLGVGGVRAVELCCGKDECDAISKCKEMVKKYFPG